LLEQNKTKRSETFNQLAKKNVHVIINLPKKAYLSSDRVTNIPKTNIIPATNTASPPLSPFHDPPSQIMKLFPI